MGISSLSIFSVILVLSVLWTPAFSNDKCDLACQKSPGGSSFQNGHTYTYAVSGTSKVFLTGGDKQETNVAISGQVAVTSHGNCVMSLKIISVAITGPDGKKYPAPRGIEKVVKFNLEDGRVGAEICAEEGDTKLSLNIKRALITLLQTEQKSSTQTDLFGVCPTEVSTSQEGGTVLIHRTRDLSRCAHREQTRSELISAVYNPTAEIKNTQLLQSTLNIETKVNNGVPEKIAAVEQYLYRPFSVGENGARAEVNTEMHLVSTTKGNGAGGHCTVPRTVIFENPNDDWASQSNAQNVLRAIKETCKTLSTEASSQSAGTFAQLIRIFRSANKEDLMRVFGQIKGNSLEKRVYLDALLRAGTGYSIEASIQLLKNKELNDIEEKVVYLSLGNARHVTSEAIKAAAGLLDLPNLPKGVYLGVGALAGTYCRDHNCHSEKTEGVVALSKKLANKLQNCKPKSKLEEDNVVAVLKGIRNIGHLEDGLIDKLVHCAVDNNVKARVRVAALEAFQADSCSNKLRKTASDIMRNRQLDSEIRIKAYLALIECPCGKSANEIKTLLESEPVNQVARFISTSLRAIRASANPDKQHARQHYGLIGIPNKYNVDDRKFSFYREMSYNVDALGVGGNVEQSVIYSQDSFIPRSVSFNLTAEMFGHNVNILEFGGRQGNLDRVIEHFLGPRGLFRTKEPQEIFDELKTKMGESARKAEKSVRGRRSIKSEVDNFDKQVKGESASYNNELDLDVYVKLFGTDAVFLSFGDGKGFDANGFLDETLKLVNEGMNKMKHFQQEIRGHLLFLDAELAYPTTTGIALKLDAVGAATGRFDISSSIDIRQCLRNPESAKVDVKLIPSTDVEISLIMLLDAGSVTTGLKVITNLHSSTAGHVIAKVIENGRGVDLQWGLPMDKQEILTASSDMVFFTAESGQLEKQRPVTPATGKNEYSGCFDQLSQVLGLTLCGKLSLPFSFSGQKSQNSVSQYLAHYPLVGSTKVNLVLEKNDLRGYHVKGVIRSDPKGRYGIELLFDAEGSRNRRTQFTADLINNQEEKTVQLSLDSPIKRLHGQFSIYTKSNEYALLMQAKMDEMSYYGRVGLNIEGNERRHVYKPVLEYQVPSSPKKNIHVDGQIIREKNGDAIKYTVSDVKFNLPESNEPVTLMGHFSKENYKYDMDLKMMKGQHNAMLSASVADYDFKADFQNTLNPYVNFKVNGHIENPGGWLAHNDIDLYYSEDCRNPDNRITLNQMYKRDWVDSQFTVTTKNKFEIHAIPLKLKLDFESAPRKVDLDVGGLYMDRKANLQLEGRTNIKKEGDYKVRWAINVDKQAVEGLIKRDIASPDKSNMENYIDFKNLGRYELSGVVLHRMKAKDVNVGAVGHLKISGPRKEEDIKFDIGYIETAKLYSSHATVTSSKGEQVNYLLKINTGANTNGQLKFNLKDAVAANGQFQMTDNDGKGNGNIMVHFKAADRVIKGEVKFVAKEPTYNADVDLFLNFGKDNNDKIHFTTANKRQEKLLDSKNKLSYGGKNLELNLHGDYQNLEKNHASVEVVLPDDRCLSFKINRDFTEKDNILNGQAEAIFSDAPKRGGPASTIKYKTKITNTDWEKNNIDMDGQLELNINGGKNLLNTYSFKNVAKEPKSDFSFKNEISGSMLPRKGIIDLTSTYTEGDTIDDDYRLKMSYGDDLAMEAVGKFQVNLPDKGERKYVEDSTISVRLPFEMAHDIKWVSKFAFNQPENQAAEITLLESVQVNADLWKIESNGKYDFNNGNTKLKILIPHVEPVSIDAKYKIDDTKDRTSGAVDVNAHYGKGKTTSLSLQGASNQKELDLKFSVNSPQNEKFRKLDINMNAKNPSPDTFNSLLVIDADGRVYKSEGLVVYSSSQPVFDLKYSSPSSPKTTRLYFKGITPRSTQGRMEVKIENVKDFDLDSTFEANFDKDLLIKFHANAETLGWKNYNVDISSKDAGSGKRLEFHAMNDNKNVLSGSTSFISKQEGPKTIIEGSGTLKVRDEQKPANFKYIRTILTEGNEQGVETFINVAYGERNHVAEFRVTNLEYKTSYVYCEEKKQCAHAEVNAKLVNSKPGCLQHQFNAGFDLRKLGLATEFGLQVANEFSDKTFPQYELNLHVNRENKKYHFHVYSQPELGKFPAGIVLTFPQRVIALESLVRYPTNKNLPFPISGEISLYPDKNKPQSKSAVRFNFDVTGTDKQGEASALIGFSHPRIGKEALVKFRGSLNRPNDNTIRIETHGVISHSCLGHDREAKFFLEVNPVHIKLLIDTPLVKVIDLEGSATAKDNLQQADLVFSLLEGKPVTMYAVAKDFQYYEFTTGYKDELERKLSVVGNLNPEKRVDVSVDIVLHKTKRNIIHGALFLEDNLIKSDYGASADNYNYFVSALRKDMNVLQDRIKAIGNKADEDFKKTMQRIEPTYKQLEQAYREDFEKLTHDLSNDKTLKEISEALDILVRVMAKLIDDIATAFKPLADKVAETVSTISKKIVEMYEKQISPGLKQLYAHIVEVVMTYVDGFIDAAAHFTALIMDFFEKHKPELQELTNIFTEIFKDLTRIVVAQLKEWRVKSSQFISELFEQIKEMPIVSMIKEKWQELAVPEQFLGIMNDVYHAAREVMPTEEAKTFLDVLRNYAQKKLRQEKFDEQKELRVVYEKLIAAVTSLVQFVRQTAGQYGITYPTLSYAGFPGFSPISLPSFKGTAGWSLITQALQGDFLNPWALIKAYRPRSLNPLDEFPAKMRAVVVNGMHIFTFDGRHLTFPGTCRYVLAHDHVDRNFTLISQLQNGHPKAIILEDKSGATIELKENGQVALNGANHGYPVIEKDVFAFREAKGRIGLGSRYGLMVFCTSKLETCYVEVSGFYHGKLRGLLGDGNNEPFDDFRIPNGKIVMKESEFGNAYKLAGSCKPVETPAHDHQQMHMALPAACEAIFGGTSPLKPLALLMDNQPFRQACIHACHDDSPKATQEACDLGRGYAVLAQTGLLPAVLPAHCLRCTDTDKPREIGEIYDVKIPAKQADIIVTVEVTQSTERIYRDIIVPLVGQVIDQLKNKRITDVKVYLVGITSKYPYPIIYDTDLKLKSAKIQFTDEARYNNVKPIQTGDTDMDPRLAAFARIIDNIRQGFGIHNVMASYDTVYDLPLRTGAVKHLISAIGDHCSQQDVLVRSLRSIVYSEFFKNIGLSYSLVKPTPHMNIGGGKDVNQVVGFSKHGVLMLGDRKQKETEALRSTIQLNGFDNCIEFSQDMDGYLFSASTFESCNPGQQKQYLQTAATSIVTRLLHENLVQVCTCSYVDIYRARSICVVKERKEAARRRK